MTAVGYRPIDAAELFAALRPAPRFLRFATAIVEDLASLDTSSRLAVIAGKPNLSGDDRVFLAAVAASFSSPVEHAAVKTKQRRRMAEPAPPIPSQLGMPALLAEYAREFYLHKPLSLTEIAKSIEREMVKNFVDAPEAERQKRRATMESMRRFPKFKPLKYRRIMDIIRHVFAVQ